MRRLGRFLLHLLFFVVATVSLSVAQGMVATGTPAFSSAGGGPFDSVNLGNLNVHFSVPVLHKSGRGVPFDYDLEYDSSIWVPTGTTSKSWKPIFNWGWQSS